MRYLDVIDFGEDRSNDYQTKVDVLDEVQSIAERGLRNSLVAGDYHRLSAKDIQYINSHLTEQRRYLKAVVDICEGMKIALANRSPNVIHIAVCENESGKSLNIRKRAKLSTAYSGLPIVIFDATPRIELLQHIYGKIEVCFSRDAKDGPRVKRFQLLDKPLSYKTLDEESWAARLVLLSELLGTALGKTGLICPKKVEDFVTEKLDTSTQINHFGALRGDISFAELPCVLVASRQAQHYEQTEDMAELLSNQLFEVCWSCCDVV